MKVSKQKPKIYDRCHEKFGVEWDKGIIITYGDTVYCKFDLGPDKLTHEETHVRQQKEFGVEAWWDKYFDDVDFRLSQEVEAYRNEAKWVRENVKERNKRVQMLHFICRDLSSSIYGNMVSYNKAKFLIS